MSKTAATRENGCLSARRMPVTTASKDRMNFARSTGCREKAEREREIDGSALHSALKRAAKSAEVMNNRV